MLEEQGGLNSLGKAVLKAAENPPDNLIIS